MQKYMRWSAILVVLMLALAACNGGGDATDEPTSGETAGETAGETDGGGGSGTAADCDADEFGCVEIAEGEPLTIGTIFVISGANETLGTDSQIGADVAQQMRPEIAGHEVEFNEQDGLCSPEGGTAAARALISVPTLAGVIGTSCSGAGVPAAEITSAEGIVLISPSNTAPSLTHPDTREAFYARTAHNDEIQGAAMAQYACEVLEAGTAATIHDGSPYAEQLQAVFAQSFQDTCGGEITAQEAVTVGETDFSGVLGNIAADSPDLLYYPIFVAEGALITQQARETAGLEDTTLAGADGMLNTDWLSASGDAGNGVFLSGPDLEFTGEFYEAEFLPAYTEISGLEEPTSVFHAHSFDAYNILADAIEEVAFTEDGTTYIPRSALRDAVLATTDHEGITGTLSCDENGDCANAQISVSEVQDGAFVRVWPES